MTLKQMILELQDIDARGYNIRDVQVFVDGTLYSVIGMQLDPVVDSKSDQPEYDLLLSIE